MRAMILAAGLGTRLRPLTDTIPKALLKVKDTTLLELQIKKIKAAGINEININVHHFADMIKVYLEKNKFFGCSIEISDESEKLLDTGGGLKKATSFFSDGKPFLVHNVDVLSNIDLNLLTEAHNSSASIATLAVQNRESSRKFLFYNEMILSGWMNEKSGERIISRDENSELSSRAFSGIQIVDPKIFKYFPDKKVFSLVELYLNAAKSEKIIGYDHSNDEWLDLGKVENLNAADNLFEKIRNTYQV